MPGLASFPAVDEKSLLLSYLAQQRDGIRNAAYGLTDEQARLTPTAGALSIGGLVKHVAGTERHWIDMVVGVTDDRPVEERMAGYQDAFVLGEGQTLAGALDGYAEVARRTEEALAGIDLSQAVPGPQRRALVPGRPRRLGRPLGAAPPDRGDGSPRRARRHRAGVDRRRHHVRAHGRRRGLAGHRLAEALGAVGRLSRVTASPLRRRRGRRRESGPNRR